MSNAGAYQSGPIYGDLGTKEASANLQRASERLGKSLIELGEAYGNPEVVAFRASVLCDMAHEVSMAAHAFHRAAREEAKAKIVDV